MRTMAAAAPACATQRRIQKLRSCIYGTPAPPAAAVNQLLEAGCKRRKQLVWALPSAEGEKELFRFCSFFFPVCKNFMTSAPGLLGLHHRSRRSSCPCSAQDIAPSRPSTVCSQQTPESALRAAAAARPTTGRFQSIPRDPHAMEAGTARLRGRQHRMLRTRVVFDCAADWTRLGVRVTRGRQPRRQRRGW